MGCLGLRRIAAFWLLILALCRELALAGLGFAFGLGVLLLASLYCRYLFLTAWVRSREFVVTLGKGSYAIIAILAIPAFRVAAKCERNCPLASPTLSYLRAPPSPRRFLRAIRHALLLLICKARPVKTYLLLLG